MADKLVVRGAREHNLKDVSIELPRNSLVVFTGLSGSGKSSLAFPPILHSLDLNGSGLMMSLISFSAKNRDVAVYDASDPAKVDTFLFSLNTLDTSRDLDLISGPA